MIRGADDAMKMNGNPRTEAGLKIMFAALRRFELEDILDVVTHHVATKNYPIKPSDVVSALEGDASDKSAIAWRNFLRALNRWGYYDSVRFPDPATHYVVMQMGGWERLSREYNDLDDREIQFREKGWRQLYEVGLKVATWENVPPYLVGNFERENREGGYLKHIPPVKEIATGKDIPHDALPMPKKQAAVELPSVTLGRLKA